MAYTRLLGSDWKSGLKNSKKTLNKRKVWKNNEKKNVGASKNLWQLLRRKMSTSSIETKQKQNSRNFVPRNILKITAVVETMRRRNKMEKRSKRSILEFATNSTNLSKECITNINDNNSENSSLETLNRYPKSWQKNEFATNFMNLSNESTVNKNDDNSENSSLEMLNRQPKSREKNEFMCHESDQTVDNINDSTNPMDFYKRIWRIINGTQPYFKSSVPLAKSPSRRSYTPVFMNSNRTAAKSPRHSYTLVFKNCNHTVESAASEVEDLNLPPPGTNVTAPFDEGKKEMPTIEKVRLGQVEKVERSKSRNEETYIDLQDHQRRNTKENKEDKSIDGNPSDIPSYDPNNIPYVEVPDYSDEREENLDKDDHLSTVERYVDYDSINSKPPRADFEKNSSTVDVKDAYSPISRVEIFSAIKDQKASSIPDEKESNGSNELQTERRTEISGVGKDIDEGRTTSKEDINDERNDSKKNSEENSALKIGPVSFDIEEYRKPFDFENFYGKGSLFEHLGWADAGKNSRYKRKPNERISAKEERDNSKNIEVGNYWDRRNDDKNGDGNGDEQVSRKSEFQNVAGLENYSEGITDEPDDDNTKESYNDKNENRDIDNIFEPEGPEDRDFLYKNSPSEKNPIKQNYAKEEKTEHDDIYRHGDKHFFAFISNDTTKDEHKSDSDSEREFIARYLTDDVAEKLKEDSSEKIIKKNSQLEENLYDTLSKILAKKDSVSRLNEDVNKRTKESTNLPSAYKNFWSLEYEFPRVMKDKMKDQRLTFHSTS